MYEDSFTVIVYTILSIARQLIIISLLFPVMTQEHLLKAIKCLPSIGKHKEA